MSTAESFDDLGAHFELTTANGAEKAYRKAVDHLTRLLVEDNAIGAVAIKRKKVIRRKKKIAAAVYEYQADYDGEWGEIEMDFESGSGKISYVAELDTTRSHKFANKVVCHETAGFIGFFLPRQRCRLWKPLPRERCPLWNSLPTGRSRPYWKPRAKGIAIPLESQLVLK